MMQPLRIGLIGCGRVAWERHLPALRHVPEARLAAFCDEDAGRLNRLADQCCVARRFTDYRELLALKDVDAVGILTPTGSHVRIALDAMDAGKHVLVEKPLALTLEDCDQLIARAEQCSTKVLVGFNLRWHRLVRRARSLIEQGALGRIKAIRSVYTHDRSGENAPDWHRRRQFGGGVIFNEAIHHFDLWSYLTGSSVEAISSNGIPSACYEDETNTLSAVLSEGILASGVFSLGTSPNSEVEIFGESGRLYLNCYRFDGLEFYPRHSYAGDLADRLGRAFRTLAELPAAIPLLRRGGDFQATFTGLWRHLAECILDGRPSQCTLQDGRRAIAVALSALDSAYGSGGMQLVRKPGP